MTSTSQSRCFWYTGKTRKREARTNDIPNSALIRVSICKSVYRVPRSSAHLWVSRRLVNHVRCRNSTGQTYVFHRRFASMTSALISFPLNRMSVPFNLCHSTVAIVSETLFGPLQRYLVIVVVRLDARGVDTE